MSTVGFIGHVIDGEEVESASGERFDSVNPWTRKPYSEVALGGRADVDRAIDAARRAFDEGPWPRMSPGERGMILYRLAELIEANSKELGLADTTDMGKPISDMLGGDVPRAALNFRFFSDHCRLNPAERLPMDSGHHAYTRYEPAGVAAAISPWNFPLMLETWKVAPALAWGNTVVLKPAEDTPASAALLAKLALEAGVPPGVLNVVHGYGPESAGQALTQSPRIDRISFTGEPATGRVIGQAAASNLVPVSMELGGNGATVVFADSDLDSAVDWAAKASFANAGQICLAGSRVFVERQIYDEFVSRFAKAAEGMVMGDPTEEDTQIGPLASEQHYRKVSSYLDTIAEDGGTVLTGGLGEGWFCKPTVVVGVGTDARVCREEVFGPVATVMPFEGEDEAVSLANDTPYGLTAMLFTESLRRAHRVSAVLRAGTVWTNCFFIRDLRAPFGGAGESGIGREGGNFSREFFTEPKAVVMDV